MCSSKQAGDLYVVELRGTNNYREQVSGLEFTDYLDAHEAAVQVRRWLSKGWGQNLPECVLGLRDELAAVGQYPGAVDVAVVRLGLVRPGVWDTAGQLQCLVLLWEEEEDRDELEDTVVVREAVTA